MKSLGPPCTLHAAMTDITRELGHDPKWPFDSTTSPDNNQLGGTDADSYCAAMEDGQ
jgi:hypothetical protein